MNYEVSMDYIAAGTPVAAVEEYHALSVPDCGCGHHWNGHYNGLNSKFCLYCDCAGWHRLGWYVIGIAGTYAAIPMTEEKQ